MAGTGVSRAVSTRDEPGSAQTAESQARRTAAADNAPCSRRSRLPQRRPSHSPSHTALLHGWRGAVPRQQPGANPTYRAPRSPRSLEAPGPARRIGTAVLLREASGSQLLRERDRSSTQQLADYVSKRVSLPAALARSHPRRAVLTQPGHFVAIGMQFVEEFATVPGSG